MVTEFGMSEKLGSVRYAGQRLQYLGGVADEAGDSSAETRETIDAEVRRIIGDQSARAEALLTSHRDALTRLAADLLQAESLDGSAVRAALTPAGLTPGIQGADEAIPRERRAGIGEHKSGLSRVPQRSI
jgi:cell division protease FtsH